MNYYALSGAVNCVVSLFCGAIVLWKNPRGTKNLAFLPLALSFALFAFFYALWQMSQTPERALLFVRIAVAFAALIPSTNFHFILTLLDAETPLRNKFKIIFYIVTIIIVLSAPTKYFIPRVEQKLDFPFWPVPGPFIHLHFINLFIPSLWALYLIWDKKSKASPLAQNKLKWVLIGQSLGYISGMTNNFLWYDIPIKPYLYLFSPIAPIIIVASYFRLAIVDFNYLFKKIFAYIGFLFISMTMTIPLLLLFVHLKISALVIMAFLVGSIFHPLIKKMLELVIRRVLRPDWAESHSVQAKREKLKESTYTYSDLARNLVDLTMGTFPAEMTAVYFYDIVKQEYYLCAQKGMKNPLTKDLMFNRSSLSIPVTDPLISSLGTKNVAIHMEAILNDSENMELQPLIGSLHRIEAEICAPFIFGEKLRGIMVIGRKKDNRLFNEEELETLFSFSSMGTEVMRYIMAMETELNHTALYSHDMNHNIRSLTQTLEFLESPMAQNQPPEKVAKLLGQAREVSERLYESFQTNRDRSALIMKMIRGEYDKAPLHISEILKISAGKFTLQAEKANVLYKVEVAPASTLMMGNESDLTRTFDNLIANALRYVPKTSGRLEITGGNTRDGYEIRVKDNGDGIDPQNLSKIFELGWQASEDQKKGAAGLGLAIVKQIVQIHDGTIQALSQGKGTGVEFKIYFPYTAKTLQTP